MKQLTEREVDLIKDIALLKREPGYYWVIFKGRKIIASYLGSCWQVFGINQVLFDEKFTTIFENKICPP